MLQLNDTTKVYEVFNGKNGHVEVTLKPKLADYSARLEYDEFGNANITIEHNVRGVVLDMSLDNGEINEIEEGFGQ